MNSATTSNYALTNWMSANTAIDILPLYKLSLPGTHNAGCDWKASYALIPGAHWVACQHKSFYDQLINGARALDLRLTYQNSGMELNKFRFQHNGFLSSRSVVHLITDIERFLAEYPDEFIVLDFHEMKDGDRPFDFAWFNHMFIKLLGNRIIPASNSGLNLQQLKSISRTQRILIHAPQHHELDRKYFNPKLHHQWIGTQTPSASDLQKFIATTMSSPPFRYAPWSLSATSYAALGGPVDIHTELDRWFDPANSDWLQNCNVVNVDFFEETRLVAFCISTNLSKARRG